MEMFKKVLWYLFAAFLLLMAIGAATMSLPIGAALIVIALLLTPFIREKLFKSAAYSNGVTWTLIIAFVGGTTIAGDISSKAKEADALARKEQSRKANAVFFEANKPEVMAKLKGLVSEKKFGEAKGIAEKYSGSADEDLHALQAEILKKHQRQKNEAEIYKLTGQLASHPANSEALMNNYIRLAELDPGNSKWQSEADRIGKKLNRQKVIEEQFSPWDGSHYTVSRLIQKNMNDPDSYDHVKTVYYDKGDHLIVNTTFRGKNAFNATIVNAATATVDLDGNVLALNFD